MPKGGEGPTVVAFYPRANFIFFILFLAFLLFRLVVWLATNNQPRQADGKHETTEGKPTEEAQ